MSSDCCPFAIVKVHLANFELALLLKELTLWAQTVAFSRMQKDSCAHAWCLHEEVRGVHIHVLLHGVLQPKQ